MDVYFGSSLNQSCLICCCLLFKVGHVLQLWSETVAVRRRIIYVMDDIWWPYDNRGRMWPKFPDICLTVEEKPRRKNLNQEIDRTWIEPVSSTCKATVLPLDHGCARVAHCVTARWRNFCHYCRPLSQYDVWFTCSKHREALPGAPTAHGVHTNKRLEFTTEQVGRHRYVTAVDGGLKRFPSVAWFAHPCIRV